ncbi:MAG: hypothetical protein AAF135_15480, partial [Bacteroidota bacterium]
LQQEIWSYQYAHNPIMHTFADALSWPPPISIPIEFFKRHLMKTKECMIGLWAYWYDQISC